jgi:hypothetical protein
MSLQETQKASQKVTDLLRGNVMKKLSKRAMAVAAMAAATAGLTAMVPQTASAATAKATYNGVCGSGYKVVESTPVGNVGTIFVTWNETAGKNCAVTVRNTSGAPVYVAVSLNVLAGHETTPARDSGQYRSYAGPVYYAARNLCVEWEGVIGSAFAGDSGACG